MSPALPSAGNDGPGVSPPSMWKTVLASVMRRRGNTDAAGHHDPALMAAVDDAGIDGAAYQKWLHHLHRTTADTFDDDASDE